MNIKDPNFHQILEEEHLKSLERIGEVNEPKGYGGGWLARHDPEELARRQRAMSDYPESEDESNLD